MGKQIVQKEGPATRFGLVRGFFIDRGVRHYQSVFSAFGKALSKEELDRFNALWASRATVTEADLPMIERLEAMVEHLKAAA